MGDVSINFEDWTRFFLVAIVIGLFVVGAVAAVRDSRRHRRSIERARERDRLNRDRTWRAMLDE